LLALVGIFDIAGTIVSGVLTDRIDPRLLLVCYYFFRGVGLLVLPWLLSDAVRPSMLLFIIVYGLDWVATVPPTAALCREAFGTSGTIVFGWVFASHQFGAALASVGAGIVRDTTGQYTLAWFGGAGLCLVGAIVSVTIRGHKRVSVQPASSLAALTALAEPTLLVVRELASGGARRSAATRFSGMRP